MEDMVTFMDAVTFLTADILMTPFMNNYEYGDETYKYIESQTLRCWNPSMKKWGRDKYYMD